MGLAAATRDAFLATCFTWAVTAAGAALVFVLPPDEATQRALLRPMLGFAGGVMTSASFFSLLAPALELAEDQLGRRWSFVPVAVGFFLGGAVGARPRRRPHPGPCFLAVLNLPPPQAAEAAFPIGPVCIPRLLHHLGRLVHAVSDRLLEAPCQGRRR